MKIFFFLFLLYFSNVVTAQDIDKILGKQTDRAEQISAQVEAQLQENTVPPLEVNFGDNLQEEYSHLNYALEQQDDDFWTNIKKNIQNLLFKLFLVENEISKYAIIEILKKTVYFLILFGVFYWSFRLIIKHKGQWFFSIEKSTNQENTPIEEQLMEIDFPKIIETLESNNDRRHSLRMYYLWYLQSLAKNGIIQWEVAKTNKAYEQDILNPNQKKDFNRLSKIYAYIWYGDFPLSEQQYQNIKNDFIAHILT